jgi:uncharacterized membrane protein
MREQSSERRRRDYKILAVMVFNLVAVWFLTGPIAPDIKHRLATMEITTLLLIPLVILYARCNWPPKLWLANLVVLLPLWFITYSALHEGSHVVGVFMVGEKIVNYHLIPAFWKGEFTSDAWVSSNILEGWRGVLPGLFPYLRDFLFLIAGWVILKSKRIENCFLVGLVFVLFCLSPVFDITDNYFNGYLVQHATGNDFTGTAMTIGGLETHVIGVLLLSFGLYVVVRILWLYSNFPSTVANVASKAQTASS